MRAFIPLLLLGLIAAGVLYFRSAAVPRPGPGAVGPLPSAPLPGTATTTVGPTSPSLGEESSEQTSEGTTEEPLAATAQPANPVPGIGDAPSATGAPSEPRRVTREPTLEERSEELVEELLEDLELDAATMGALAELLEERLLWRAEASVAPPTSDERRAKDAALEASLVELYGDDVGQEVLQMVLAADL